MVLGQVIAEIARALGQFDQSQTVFEKCAERQAIAVEVVENPEFEHG
jgi:hypothetical protein